MSGKYPVIKPGRYVGVITKAELAVSVNGNNMIKASLLVPHPEITSEDVTFVHENVMLIPSCAWRLPHISAAIGCETSDLLENMKGTVVSLELGSETHPEYGEKNTITQWHAATEEEKARFDSRDSSTGGGGGTGKSDEESKAALDALLKKHGKKIEKKAKHATPVRTVPDDDIPF